MDKELEILEPRYFVNSGGQVFKYNRVKKYNLAPQTGSDILIQDERGIIYSGNSKSYFADKKEALEAAKTRLLDFIKTYETAAQDYRDGLKKVEEQLKNES